MGTILILIIFQNCLLIAFLFMKNWYDFIINITMTMFTLLFVFPVLFSASQLELCFLLIRILLYFHFDWMCEHSVLSLNKIYRKCVNILVVHCTQNIRYDRSVGDFGNNQFKIWKHWFNRWYRNRWLCLIEMSLWNNEIQRLNWALWLLWIYLTNG